MTVYLQPWIISGDMAAATWPLSPERGLAMRARHTVCLTIQS